MAKPSAHVDPRYSGQEPVKNDEVVVVDPDEIHGLLTGTRDIDDETLFRHPLRKDPGCLPIVLDELRKKRSVAVITDAGTPLISDPGSRLVHAVREAGFRVSPIPGASALTAALSAAGLDTSRFTFVGFIPRTGRERKEVLELIATLTHTAVLYEAPNRVADTLREIAESSAPERGCVVAREITKLFEEFRSGTVEELRAYYADSPPRGEVVILLAGAGPKTFNQEELQNRLKALREGGKSARDAAAQVAAETGVPRNVVYRIAVKV